MSEILDPPHAGQLHDARASSIALPIVTPEMKARAIARLSAMQLVVRFSVCDPTNATHDGYLIHDCFRMAPLRADRCSRHAPSKVANHQQTR